MSADANKPTPASAAFADAFRRRAQELGIGGQLGFADFMALALYHPELGYYRRGQLRVGRSPGSDFYTATSSGPLFGELICAACVTLLGDGQDPRHFTFVEIGAEPSGGILKNVSHPFAAVTTVRIGEPLDLSRVGTQLVVFSNELFDAQPFRRFVIREDSWRELAVEINQDGTLREVEAAAVASLPEFVRLPEASSLPGGYHLDLPIASTELIAALAKQNWTGLFVACDYGKSWRELTEVTSQGTARAYYRHQQSNDLLARPGEQDLTCHVCWDWLADALARHGFSSPRVESQEAFFIHHAGDFIARLTAAEASRVSTRKLSLMQLLHPANMGQKFQVLHALRK